MKASIIIPVYNTAPYLKQCVESVLQQTHTEFELILVDDGSTDTSPDLCDELAERDGRIRVIHQANAGLSAARNSGLKASESDVILFLDSDDYWKAEDGLACIIETFNRTSCDVVEFGCWKFWEDTTKIIQEFHPNTQGVWENEHKKEATLISLLEHGALTSCAWNKAIHRRLFANYDLSFREGVIAEDIDWTARLMIAAGSVICISKPIVAYRKRKASITADMNPVKFSQLVHNVRYVQRAWGHIPYITSFLSLVVCSLILDMSRLPMKSWKQFHKKVRSLSSYLEHSATRRVRLIRLTVSALGLYGTCFIARIVRLVK